MKKRSKTFFTKSTRWFQFKLTSLLLTCVLVGLYFSLIHSTNEVVTWIEANNGIVSYTFDKFNRSSLVRNYGKDVVDDSNGWRIDRNVWAVDFASCENLKEISRLERLKNLQFLNLSKTQITDFSPLRNLTMLRELDLSGTSIQELDVLVDLETLRELNLSNTRIGDVSQLARLTNLEILRLDNTLVSKFDSLSKLRMLRELSICGTTIESLNSLNGVGVESLFMDETYFTDWTPLKRLTTPKTITLRNSSIDVDNLARLREALPNCVIIGYPRAKEQENGDRNKRTNKSKVQPSLH